MSWTTFVENGKISIRFLLPIALLSASFLFLPELWKQKLHIDNLSDTYAQYIGPAFLISSVLILIDITVYIYNSIRLVFTRSKNKKNIKNHISKLTSSEKAVLREFFMNGHDTIPLPFTHPTVAGLINKWILVQVSSHGGIFYGEPCFNFTISDTARTFITYDLIDLPVKPTSEDIIVLSRSRPDWLK
jgi:hypothetical protein